MNNIEELIAQICPNGVEFRELGEVCENIVSGKNIRRDEAGKFPVYGSTGIIGHTNTHVYDKECLLIARVGANAGFVHKGTGKFDVSDNTLIVNPKDKYNLSFAFYQLSFLKLNNLAVGGGQPLITAGLIKRIKIPLPPLTIQQAIVNILDKFTQLQAELQAELQARRAQYEYYRNELLNFEGKEVVWKELQDFVFYPKSRISATTVNNENYVGVENLLKDKQGKTLSNYVPTTGALIGFLIDDILIGNIRPYLKKIWLATNNGGTNGDVVVFRIKPENKKDLSSKFLFFLLSSDKFFDYDMQSAKGAKMPRGDKSSILKYRIPIPPLAEQNRIVAILDQFDKLVNDISEGLPAEIQARRKQYEYYRGKLLTFKCLNP